MNTDQRNKILNRIMSDYFIIYINRKKYIIKRPTRHILHEAQLLYEKTLSSNKYNDWASEQRCLLKLMQLGKWPVDGDQKISNLDELSNNLKVELCFKKGGVYQDTKLSRLHFLGVYILYYIRIITNIF